MRASTSLSALRVWVIMCACCALLCGGPLGAYAAEGAASAAQPPSSPTIAPAQSNGPGPGSAVGPEFADADAALDVVSLNPYALEPGGTFTAEVEVTNQSSEPLESAVLDLSMRSTRVTDRSEIPKWTERSGSTDLEGLGRTVASSPTATIAPGGKTRLTVTAEADDLPVTNDESLWGPRRISLSLRTDAEPSEGESSVATGGTTRAVVRTFLVWQPSASPPDIDLSYLAPVALADPALIATDPEGYASEVEKGEFADRAAIAENPAVTPWVDPSLFLPVALPEAKNASARSGATQAAPVTAKDSGATWQPQTVQHDVNDRLSRALHERPFASSPFAGMNAAALASMPAEARNAISQESARPGNGPMITRVSAAEASTSAVLQQAKGADAVVLPAESMNPEARPAVTPSGYGQLTTGGSTTPLLGYDTPLTHLTERIGSGDPEAQVAQALADTSVVAGQDTDARRALLVAPDSAADLDPKATAQLLDAFDEADWITPTPATSMVSWAKNGSGTHRLREGSGRLWPAPVTSLKAVSTRADGLPTHVEAHPGEQLPSDVERDAGTNLTTLASVRSTLADPQYANGAFLLTASALNDSRIQEGKARERLTAAAPVVKDHAGRIRLTMADNYNLVASGAGVPVTVHNDFDTPAIVTPRATVSNRIVRVQNQPSAITIPARSSTNSKLDIEALTSGTLNITVALSSPDGARLHSKSSELSVNPDWENWSTLTLAIVMALLVIVGVIRAGRTKSDARAPAERGPEDLHAVDAPHAVSNPTESDSAS